MCSNCQTNNCGCQEPVYDLCNKCVPEPCTCPVEITTNCITLAENLECSGVEAGTNFTEAIQQLDEYVCSSISELGASINLVNVGGGAQIYKGVDGIGRKEIKTLTSDSSLTITENINTINLSVNQNNFVRFLVINPSSLPEEYSEQDICDYILSLPASSRTVLDTDSKWNIIIGFTQG